MIERIKLAVAFRLSKAMEYEFKVWEVITWDGDLAAGPLRWTVTDRKRSWYDSLDVTARIVKNRSFCQHRFSNEKEARSFMSYKIARCILGWMLHPWRQIPYV